MTALEAAARAHDLTCHIRLLHFLLLIISIFSFCLVGARFISHVDKREPTLTGVSLAVVVLVVCLPCNVICITKPSLATTIKQTGALYLSWSARQEMMCQLALGETSRGYLSSSSSLTTSIRPQPSARSVEISLMSRCNQGRERAS